MFINSEKVEPQNDCSPYMKFCSYPRNYQVLRSKLFFPYFILAIPKIVALLISHF